VTDPIKKIAVVGLGAVGGVFAGLLGTLPPSQKVQLSAIARGKTLAALQTQGLVWTDASGQTHQVALTASDDPADLGPQDVVIVAVKSPSLAAVAPLVQGLLAPHTVVLVAMNGVPWWFFEGLGGPCDGLQLPVLDPKGLIAQCMPSSQVLGCVVHFSAQSPSAGVVQNIKGNHLIIGEPSGGVSARAQALADCLQAAGFDVKLSPRIQQDIWFKLWGNMTMNPVSALTGAPCDQILDDDLVRAFCSAVMLEAQAIGGRIGCEIAQVPEDRHAVTRKLGSFKTSMLQDVEHQRQIELDALLGAVRAMGEHLQLPTPNIDALYGLTRLMARTRGLYPLAGVAL
jgi:2-dehydropantoate 2-reductase